ncbi:uncharacterized protein [Euphorbia lathyris]|uniref:uncharacterized protein n=1 Tax=Euphorbia lathyris TaxID=212925 RepID=UPI003314048C
MHREGEGRNDIFSMGDPFGDFRSFGMTSSIFGGRDPFNYPFFTTPNRPFGSMFESNLFGHPTSATSETSHISEAKGVVIEELSSDDEGEKEKDIHRTSGKGPSVEHPDDDLDDLVDERSKNVNLRNDSNRVERTKPQTHNFSFQTCKVTYGGWDGAYYSSTRTRSAGTDGVIIEESKEADKTTGQATHRISRGIHDKGHSVTRKLNSDGKVDTMQTLHNLEEDELTGFEERWKGNMRGQRLGSRNQFDMHGGPGSSNSEHKGVASWGGWALPSVEQPRNTGATFSGKTRKVVRINIE